MTVTISSLRIKSSFNSHPHKEDDGEPLVVQVHGKVFQLTSSQGGWHAVLVLENDPLLLSTHILTRRMTEQRQQSPMFIILSTHILTRRMTVCFYIFNGGWDLSTHILTRRMTVRRLLMHYGMESFNSHPHKEDDNKPSNMTYREWIFQLTSSQGGWPTQLSDCCCTTPFNSHPHKEDDYTI